MEESGHYYTVYFTSLAVGFDEQTAYRHAVLAQMPDEVGAMDAHDLHMNECLGQDDFDLDGNKGPIDPKYRFSVEYGIHSLPGNQSGDTSSLRQQKLTRKLLRHAKADSLEFGLLLHRLGDSYAHSLMDNDAEMYTVPQSPATWLTVCNMFNVGHARGVNLPDYPFLRILMFDRYVDDLYKILRNKHQHDTPWRELLSNSCPKTLTLAHLKSIFQSIIDKKLERVNLSVRIELAEMATSNMTTNAHARQVFIQQIREKCFQHLGVVMKPYAPELQGTQSLQEFLFEHPELDELKIDGARVRQAIKEIQHKLDQQK